MKLKTILLTPATALAVFLGAAILNDVYGTSTTVGEPYTESFSYCGAYTGVGGTRHCSLWLAGTETRINTKVNGLFWDRDGYKVVR